MRFVSHFTDSPQGDLGYQPGNAVSNIVTTIDESSMTSTYPSPFDQVWRDPDKLEDVMERFCDHCRTAIGR